MQKSQEEENPMNRCFAVGAGLLLAMFLMVTNCAAQTKTFKGEITDDKLNCIQTPLKAAEGIKDKHACVLYWAHYVEPAEKFVLYDAATKTTYQLDDQNMALLYVAEKVEVTGTLDAGSKTIKVTAIKSDESASKADKS
jgi:hypothetical protein